MLTVDGILDGISGDNDAVVGFSVSRFDVPFQHEANCGLVHVLHASLFIAVDFVQTDIFLPIAVSKAV